MKLKQIALAVAAAVAAPLKAYHDEHLAMYAVVNTKSTIVTNADANSADLTGAYIHHGRLREQVATVEVAAADDDTSVFRFFRVWSGWRISSLEYANDALTSGTSFDIGLLQTAENGGSATGADADIFATAVDLSSAHDFTACTYEATATNISKVEKRIWELLGQSADPQRWYDVAVTANTIGSAAGTISMRMRYVDGT